MANDDVRVQGLEDVLKSLDSLMLTKEQKIAAVDAGADEYIKHLVPKIPVDDNRKNGKHLTNRVTYKSGQYEDGSTDVGFSKKGYYYRFLNDGTKKMPAQHFMEHASDEAKEDIQQAMINKVKGDKS